jgi:hypothetical protein
MVTADLLKSLDDLRNSVATTSKNEDLEAFQERRLAAIKSISVRSGSSSGHQWQEYDVSRYD